MGQFIKFTFASCLGALLAMAAILFLLVMIGVGAATAGKKTAVESNSVLKLTLDYDIPEHTNNIGEKAFKLQQQDVIGVQDLLSMITDAASDDKIKGIYINPSQYGMGPVTTAEIAHALREFRESGKWVLSYGEYFPQGGYALAAQADTIILNPIGSVDFRGFASFVPFFKELMDKVGIKAQIYYAGNFKSATEPFRRTDMSPESKLQTREYLDDAYGHFLQLIADGRGIEVGRLKEIADGLKSGNASDALSLKMVDMIGYEDEASAWMRRHMGLEEDDKINFIDPAEYHLTRTSTSGARDRIAVVYCEGEIIPGEGDYGTIGDKRYTDILSEIRKNERVKAVVLRVNSPGGNILASENILREVQLLKKAGKPVVVSMGTYAASGGYYISADADSIFAEPTTLTGSIGVFTMLFNPHELLNDKLGIWFDTVRTGEYSAAFSPFFEWSEPEHEYMKVRTDEFYDLFLTHVSNARGMTKEEVHAIAQGRIWSGDRAVNNGLVDRLGSLDDAIASAASLADLSDYRTSEYPRVLNPLSKLIADVTGQETSVTERYLDHKLEDKIPHFLDLKAIINAAEPTARLPVIIDF